MANRYIGEVAAPEFGDGFTIRLDMAGQGELESKFGAFEFAHKLGLGLAIMSSEFMIPFLEQSLRGPDGELVRKVPDFSPLEPVARKCLDAFALFRYGKTHDEWVADNTQEAVKPKANPTTGTTA